MRNVGTSELQCPHERREPALAIGVFKDGVGVARTPRGIDEIGPTDAPGSGVSKNVLPGEQIEFCGDLMRWFQLQKPGDYRVTATVLLQEADPGSPTGFISNSLAPRAL